jgi:hypothetical protein
MRPGTIYSGLKFTVASRLYQVRTGLYIVPARCTSLSVEQTTGHNYHERKEVIETSNKMLAYVFQTQASGRNAGTL